MLKSTKDVKKWLEEAAAADRAASITERDVEFLKSIGVNLTLEELRAGCRKGSKLKKK